MVRGGARVRTFATLAMSALLVAGCGSTEPAAAPSGDSGPWTTLVARAAPEVPKHVEALGGCDEIASEDDLLRCAIAVGDIDEATTRVDQDLAALGAPPDEIKDRVTRTREALQEVLSAGDEECFNGASKVVEAHQCRGMIIELRAALKDLESAYATWPTTP